MWNFFSCVTQSPNSVYKPCFECLHGKRVGRERERCGNRELRVLRASIIGRSWSHNRAASGILCNNRTNRLLFVVIAVFIPRKILTTGYYSLYTLKRFVYISSFFCSEEPREFSLPNSSARSCISEKNVYHVSRTRAYRSDLIYLVMCIHRLVTQKTRDFFALFDAITKVLPISLLMADSKKYSLQWHEKLETLSATLNRHSIC